MEKISIDSTEICENLQNVERSLRQKSLAKLLEFYDCPESPSKDIQLNYEECYLHILNCYADKFENCRELACNVITSAITKLPKNDYYLQYVVTTLAGRIGKKEIIETSEELRLLLLQQLHFLITKYGNYDKNAPDLLLRSYNEIIDVLLKTLTDNYPAVQKEACSCIKSFSIYSKSFYVRAEILAKPIIPLLHHKHSNNRIAAIESLGIICMHITSKSEFVIQIMTEISPLLMDPMPLVRLECGKVGCHWLLNLLDRYSYFERILPLVLCCLKDDSPDVRVTINSLWKKCGELYYDENESELNTLEIVDEKSANYPPGVERPTLGCRALVQRSLRMVKLIMRESSDWKDDVRLHSLKLMYQFVLHAETKLTAVFFEIYPDLSKSCADSQKEVATEALKVADLMGRLLFYNDWIGHGIEFLAKHPRLGFLKCFYGIYSATTVYLNDDITKISKIISENEFSHSFKPEFQKYLLKLSEILWERACVINQQNKSLEPAENVLNLNLEEIQNNLYHVVVKVMSLSFDDNDVDEIYLQGKSFLSKLSNGEDVQVLHGKHLLSVLQSFDCLDAEIDDKTESILLLHGVIRICGFKQNYLSNLIQCIKTVWVYALPDGKVKVFSAISIAMLNWSKTIDLDCNQSEKALREFVEIIILPHMKWKAGASAEAMRSFATATLCAMTQGAKDEAPKILPQYAKYFPNLIEDNSFATRRYALKCFLNFGYVAVDQLKPIGYAILQRLDDPCSEIREWAARVFSQINVIEEKNENDIWNNLIKHAFSMLFIHFDGPELKLREYVKESLVILGKKYPDMFKAKHEEALTNFTNIDDLLELSKLVIE